MAERRIFARQAGNWGFLTLRIGGHLLSTCLTRAPRPGQHARTIEGRQEAYDRRGSRSTGSATTQKPHASYLDRVRVVKFPRRLIRHLETPDLPLQTLQAIRRLRRYLEELEAACIIKARELGASPSDIGEALGITRQAVYNRLHNLELRAKSDPEFVIPDLSSDDGRGSAEETIDLESSSDRP